MTFAVKPIGLCNTYIDYLPKNICLFFCRRRIVHPKNLYILKPVPTLLTVLAVLAVLTVLTLWTVLTVWTVLAVWTVLTVWTEIAENLKKYDLFTHLLTT